MSVVLPKEGFDFSKLGFSLTPTNGFVMYKWKDGKWNDGEWQSDPYIPIHVATISLNYGQSAFEGFKVFRMSDNTVKLFRPQENSKRLNHSAETTMMANVPEEVFLKAAKRLIAGNLEYIPPHSPDASKGSFYVRPLLFGSGADLNLAPADEYTFLMWGTPVGSYYGQAAGNVPAMDAIIVDRFDRAAPYGVGSAKLAGNYAPVFKHQVAAKKAGYQITLHLDSAQRKYIDEFSTSNWVGIIYPPGSPKSLTERPGPGTKIVVPDSESVLKSITTKSACEMVKEVFGWEVERRPVAFEEVKQGVFNEVGACGTAAMVAPIKSISYTNPDTNQIEKIVIGDGQKAGPGFLSILSELTAIQTGTRGNQLGWLWPEGGIKVEN